MKKTLLYVGAALLCTVGLQSCSNEDNIAGDPYVSVIDDGADLSDLVAEQVAAGATEVTLTLPADKQLLQIANPIEVNVPLTIEGEGEAPVKVIAKKGIVAAASVTLKNLAIDATELAEPLIALSPDGAEKKNQDVYTDAATTDFNLLDAITIDNVLIKNLQNSLVSSNGQDWAIVDLNITNSIIQLDNDKNTFIALDKTKNNKGAVKNINIQNNTIYNLKENKTAYFIRFANASNAQKAFGRANDTSTYDWNISNNTIIRTFTAKDFANNMVNNPKVTNTVSNNVFYDVFRVYQYLQNNQTRSTVNNYIFYDVTSPQSADTGGRTDKDGNAYTTLLETAPFAVPTAALDLDAENGGLNLAPAGLAEPAGDPRWLK